jgi:hypothetical protein
MDHGRLNPGVYRITVEADTFFAPDDLAGDHENWGNAAAYLELTTLLGIWGTRGSPGTRCHESIHPDYG